MTSLEHKLACLIQLIEQAKLAGDARALAALVRRKEAICTALAAPEQSWDQPLARAAPTRAAAVRTDCDDVRSPTIPVA